MSKRAAAGGGEPPAKKLHSFFTAPNPSTIGSFDDKAPPTIVHYVHEDPLQGTKPDKPVQLVLYDLDGTLITPRSGNKFPKGSDDWKWWHDSLPGRLKEDVKEGKHVVVVSNQAFKGPKVRREWREKLPLIAAKLNIPFRVLAALEKDKYRKPRTGMVDFLLQLYKVKGWEVDHKSILYVGDAAGRKGDHSNTDYTLALNAGIRFTTPEEHFLGFERTYPIPPKSFRPSDWAELGTLPPVVPSNLPIATANKEIVLFVGSPASGKTTFFRRHFTDYEHVNQDTLKSRDRCVRVAREHLETGRSVVIDNTNRDVSTRAYYVQLANALGVPIRVFHFTCPVELARHNNAYRAFYAPPDEPPRAILPETAFTEYRLRFEPPKLSEGFDELRTVNFVWDGTEAQRALWDRYMF